MNQKILTHFLEFSTYTNPGLYQTVLKNSLPNEVRELGLLVRQNIIHRSTLEAGNVGTNADLRFGDMKAVPWWRQPEDDVLTTAVSMLAELYRRDERGFVADRKASNKLVLTCRFVSILMASILKSKGIPTRVRAGHAGYFDMEELGNVSTDHWINQYWNEQESRWVTMDVDGSLSLNDQFDPYDIPVGKFDFPADAWLAIRRGKVDAQHFVNAKPESGLIVVLWSLLYDLHCLMNNEIIYSHIPLAVTYEKFKHMSSEDYEKIDELAKLMQNPDKNFDQLTNIFETEKDFRLLAGGLL